jgi:hypothetical protein
MLEALGGGSVANWGEWDRALKDFPTDASARLEARDVFHTHFTEAAYQRRSNAMYSQLLEMHHPQN